MTKEKIYFTCINIYSSVLNKYMNENYDRIVKKFEEITGFSEDDMAEISANLFIGDDWDNNSGELYYEEDDLFFDEDGNKVFNEYVSTRKAIIEVIYEDYPELKEKIVTIIRS